MTTALVPSHVRWGCGPMVLHATPIGFVESPQNPDWDWGNGGLGFGFRGGLIGRINVQTPVWRWSGSPKGPRTCKR